jgi:hypothetical protein
MTTVSTATFTSSSPAPGSGRARAIGRLGTTARVLVGAALIGVGVISGGRWIGWWQLALGLVGMPAAIVVAQFARLAFTKRPLVQTSHVATCINCAAIVGLLTASATRDATLVFLGTSMLLAASRGYAGCETLAISNWLLRRDDQVGCLLFSPVDRVEGRGHALLDAYGPASRYGFERGRDARTLALRVAVPRAHASHGPTGALTPSLESDGTVQLDAEQGASAASAMSPLQPPAGRCCFGRSPARSRSKSVAERGRRDVRWFVEQASRSAGSERSVSSRAAQIDGAVETAARRPVRNRGRRLARPPALAERQSVASRSLA